MRITTTQLVTRTTERLVRVGRRVVSAEVVHEELVVLEGDVVDRGEEEPTIDVLEPKDLDKQDLADAEERLWFAYLEKTEGACPSI